MSQNSENITDNKPDDWGSSENDQNHLIKRGPIFEKDIWIYRIIISSISFGIIICLLGAIYLAAHDKDIPEILIAIGSASVGALAGLLSPNRKN